MAFCETRMSENLIDTYRVPGYTFFHQCRNRHGGGVALLLNDYLSPEYFPNVSYIYKAENVFLCVSLCVCPFAIEIHTSKAMTMSVCTRINTRPGKVLVDIRS